MQHHLLNRMLRFCEENAYWNPRAHRFNIDRCNPPRSKKRLQKQPHIDQVRRRLGVERAFLKCAAGISGASGRFPDSLCVLIHYA
jgi:hypothetical protein